MSDPDRPDWAEPEDDAPDWAESAPAPRGRYASITSKPTETFDDEEPEVRGRINTLPVTEVVGDVTRGDEVEIPDPIRRGMESIVNDLRRAHMDPMQRAADRNAGGWTAPAGYDPAAIPAAFGQAVTLGHADELGAGIRAAARGSRDGRIDARAYEEELAGIRRREAALRERNPIGTNIGTGLGALALGAAIPSASVAAGEAAAARGIGALGQFAARTGAAALEGSAFGAGAASGHSEHDAGSAEYFGDVAQGAGQGALLSGGIEAGTSVPGLIATGMRSLGRGARAGAAAQRLASAGARARDLQQAERTFPGGQQGLADALNESGITRGIETIEDIAPRASEVRRAAGTQMGEILSRASPQQAADDVAYAYREALPPAGLPRTEQVAQTLRERVVAPLRQRVGGRAASAAAELEDWIADMEGRAAGGALTPQRLHELQVELADLAKYDSNTSNLATQAYRDMRRILGEEVDASLARAGETLSEPALASEYARARRHYGAASRAEEWARRQADRESANRLISPSDYAAAGAQLLNSGSLLQGGAAWVANRILRRREHSMAASGLERLASWADMPEAAQILSPAVRQALANARNRGPAAYAATVYAATMNASPEEREAIQQAMEGGAPSQETAP